MIHLIIDGYNYIGRTSAAGIYGGADVEGPRRSLLDKLAAYKRRRGTRITVVFDAYNSFSLGRQRENYKGVDVVYSKEGETADEVIIEIIRSRRAGIAVVTSDRAIIDEAKAHDVTFITPSRLREMISADAETANDKEDDDDAETGHGSKKGNPRKLPKKLRKVTKTLRKI